MHLLAVLATPPVTSGVRTINRVRDAALVLGASAFSVVNLFSLPTRDVKELFECGADGHGWASARLRIREGLADADALLCAWGVSPLTGTARKHRLDQLRWLEAEAGVRGLDKAWTAGGAPRHPSRWHQYVSDVHGRVSGGTFQERLKQVLTEVPMSRVCA